MNSRRQATLSDIAQDVGVSTATVSRVLANAPGHRAGKDTRRANPGGCGAAGLPAQTWQLAPFRQASAADRHCDAFAGR